MILETHWSYDDLNDAPEDIVFEIVDMLRERSEAQKHPGGEVTD